MKFDSKPSYANVFGSVVDFDFVTSFDSVTDKHFMLSILQLIMDSSQQCDQLRYNMYTNIVIMGNLSGNV